MGEGVEEGQGEHLLGEVPHVVLEEGEQLAQQVQQPDAIPGGRPVRLQGGNPN